MNRDPDDRGQPEGPSGAGRSNDEEFERIVSGWRREGTVPVWPDEPRGMAERDRSRSPDTGPIEPGPIEPDPDIGQVDTTQLDLLRLDAAPADPAQIDPVHVDPAQIDPAQIDTVHLDPAQADTTQLDTNQINGQISAGQISGGQIGAGNPDAGPADADGVDTAQLDLSATRRSTAADQGLDTDPHGHNRLPSARLVPGSASAPGSRSHRISENDPDEHFVPPEPPPLPALTPSMLVGVALVLIGLVLLVAPGWLGVSQLYSLPLGLVGIAAGLGWLMLRMWPSDPGPPGPPSDDGAVV